MKKLRIATIISLMLLMSIYAVSNIEAGTKKIKLNKKTITLNVGEKKTIKVKTKAKVNWKSGDTKVATVSKKGVVKAKNEGNTKITASDKNNKKIKAVCRVKVKQTNNIDNTTTPTQEPKNTPTPCNTGIIWVVFDHIEKIDDEWSYLYGKPDENAYKDTLIHNGIDMLKLKTRNSQIEKLNPVKGDNLTYIFSNGLKSQREGNTLNYYGDVDDVYALMYNDGQKAQLK